MPLSFPLKFGDRIQLQFENLFVFAYHSTVYRTEPIRALSQLLDACKAQSPLIYITQSGGRRREQ